MMAFGIRFCQMVYFCQRVYLIYHMVFIDLEKAYDKVPRNVMWWALEKHKIPTKYITLIKDMYKDATMFVRTCDGNTTDFLLTQAYTRGQH